MNVPEVKVTPTVEAEVKFGDKLKKNGVFRLYKYLIADNITIVKKQGLKALWKKRGWKFFTLIFFYYLIRDSIIYILLPLLIAWRILL